MLLSEYNKPATLGDQELRDEARTYRQYYYTSENLPTGAEATGATVVSGDDSHVYQTMEWQTSGNFIHPSKRIVDDCYPTNNAYIIGSSNYSEAHYWYVKGEVYIYDQKVSAYTGSATAYSKEVHLPLTITAASNGKLQLLNVKPNLYAYYTEKDGQAVKIGTADKNGEPIDKVWVNNESDSYELNDVISWWDWQQLSPNDRQYFVTETYVNCVTCTIDGVEYEQGTYVMDQTDYDKFMAKTHDIRDAKGDKFKDDDGNDIGKTFVFRSSNNVSHETGYLLTFDMNTPKIWDDYYSPATGSSADGKIMKSEYEAKFTDGMTDAQKQAVVNAWREGPTFTPTESGVYGKQSYKAGEVITEATYLHAGEGQEKMETIVMAGLKMIDWPEMVGYVMLAPYFQLEQDENGIAYTPYYYYNTIVNDDRTQVIGVNSIVPDKKTIENGTYPYVTEVMASVRADTDKSSTTYQLFYQLATGQHNAIVKESGYSVIEHAGR